MRAFTGLIAAICLAACSSPPEPGAAAPPEWTTGQWSRACKYDLSVLPELSGLTPSVRHEDTLWAINDSGNAPELIAIDATTCEVRARVTVSQQNVDWEALASGRSAAGNPVVWIGDIGDNGGNRDSVSIIEVPEPDLGTSSVSGVRRSFRYPDGPVDAEALMARGGRFWVVTKQFSGAVFQVRLGQGTAQKVGSAAGYTTDAAVSPESPMFAVRDYPTITRYRGLPPGDRLGRSNPPQQKQAEAVAFSRDGRWLYTASEGDARLLRAPVVLQ